MQKIKSIIKLNTLCVLLAATVLATSACGAIDGMFDFLKGGEDTDSVPDYSADGTESEDSGEAEIPYTDSALFETAPFDEGLMITGYTGTDATVNIPPEINGLKVLALSDKAVKDGEDYTVERVIIPDTVEQIAYSAFSGCKKLSALTVPFVGGRADNHTYLGYVFGARGHTGNASAVPESLVSVTAGGLSVEDSAFAGCESLESVTLKNVITVGKDAFKGCTALKTLVIPETVGSIGEGAFTGCDNLFDITLPFLGNGGDKLFFGAVFGAENYTSNFDYIPSTLRYVTLATCPADIPEGAFYECNSIVNLTVNSGVETIGKNAFYRCRRLKKLIVNGGEGYSGIRSLAEYSFGYCAAIGEVKLSTDITELPEGAFYGCSALRSVYFGEEVNKMPGGVLAVGEGAFAYCENLTAMELSSSLTVIESQSFYGCSYLLEVKLPQTVTEVKTDAFKGCTGLKKLELGTGITTIGNGAFSYCSALRELVLPGNITFIGDNAFAYSKYLENTLMQNKDTALGNDVFTGCERIVVTVDPSGTAYSALLESGLGNTNLKSPE